MTLFLRRFDLKIVLLGDKASGKTCLLHQYITQDYRDTLPSTFDTAFAAKKVTLDGGRQVALAVWDTAGSPHFQHVSRLYIRGADVILVCYDITSRNNWERLKLWVHEARTRMPGCPVYLVCTKVDMLQQQPEGQRAESSGGRSEGEGSPASSADSSAQELQLEPDTPGGLCPISQQSNQTAGKPAGSISHTTHSPVSMASPPSSSFDSRPHAAGGSPVSDDHRPPCATQPPEPSASSSQAGQPVPASPPQLKGGAWETATATSSKRQLHFAEPQPEPQPQLQPLEQGEQGSGRRGLLRQAVPDAEVELYCSSIGAKMFKTSAKTGEGVSEMFQSISEECCARGHPVSAPTSPSKQPQKTGHPWSWRGQQGRPEQGSSPPTPTTPLCGAPPPASFPTATRLSTDSGSDAGESGRQPGITHSHEWLKAAEHAPTRAHGASPPQLQLQPGEYVLDELAFVRAPQCAGRQGGQYDECWYEEEVPRGMPQLDYNARGSCTLM